MSEHAFNKHKDGVVINFKVSPGASRTAVSDVTENTVRIRVAAPPVEGKANKEIIKFLSKLFKIPKSNIQIIGGEKSKNKIVLLQGIDLEDVRGKIL